MRTLITALLLLLAFPATAETYRWVDEDGVVHYSDRPVQGAELVTLEPAQGFTPAPATRRSARAQAGEAVRYESVEIVSPSEDEVLFNIETRLGVQVAMVPALAPEHFLRLTINGEDVTEKPVRSRSFQVEGVYRGTHTAQVLVVDADGTVIQQSPVRTFHVRQNIAKPQQQPR